MLLAQSNNLICSVRICHFCTDFVKMNYGLNTINASYSEVASGHSAVTLRVNAFREKIYFAILSVTILCMHYSDKVIYRIMIYPSSIAITIII